MVTSDAAWAAASPRDKHFSGCIYDERKSSVSEDCGATGRPASQTVFVGADTGISGGGDNSLFAPQMGEE